MRVGIRPMLSTARSSEFQPQAQASVQTSVVWLEMVLMALNNHQAYFDEAKALQNFGSHDRRAHICRNPAYIG
jgi:hypothetical protein